MTLEEITALIEPAFSNLSKHFETLDIQPSEKLDLATGTLTEVVVITLTKTR